MQRMTRMLVTTKTFCVVLGITWIAGVISFIYFENNVKDLITLQNKVFEMDMDNADLDLLIEQSNDEFNDVDDSDDDNNDEYDAGGINNTFDKRTFFTLKQVLYESIKSNEHSLGYRYC
jgi:hypothetical protein